MSTGDLRLADNLRQVLDEAVRRIVEIAQPEAVILFGSHAEGSGQANSDFDLLVIADTEEPRRMTERLCGVAAEVVHGRWREVPSFDIIVMTPEEWRHESQLPGQLAFRAKRRGVTVHGRAA